MTMKENNLENVKEVPVQEVTIGEHLRSCRKQLGMGLGTLSEKTKIYIKMLEHLENNNFSELPNIIYVRGFVKSITHTLKIDQQEALNILEKTYHPAKKLAVKEIEKKEIQNEVQPHYEKNKEKPSNNLFIKLTLGIFILGFVGFSVKKIINDFPEHNLKAESTIANNIPKVELAPTVQPVVEIQPEKAPEPQIAPTEKQIIDDKNEININGTTFKRFTSKTKQFYENKVQSTEETKTEIPQIYQDKMVEGIENLFISAVDGDSWITFKIDDQNIKQFVLNEGKNVFLNGKKIILFIGNTKAIKLFYNNKLITLSSKSKVTNLVFPEEAKGQYWYPLFYFAKDERPITSEEYIKNNR